MDRLILLKDGSIKAIFSSKELNGEIERENDLRCFNYQELKSTMKMPYREQMIKAENIYISNNGYRLDSPINFRLHRGECMALIGENGIGKTRLLNDIVNRHSDRILIFKRGDDYFIDNSNVGEFALRTSDNDIYINLNYLSLSELPIIKLSNSIEIIVNSSEHDISTSRMLHEENLLAINKKDMNSQIKFILSSDNFDAVQDILSFSGKVISVNFNFNFNKCNFSS